MSSRWTLLLCLVLLATSLRAPRGALAQPVKRIGAELRVNSYTQDDQRDPAVATDALGRFVLVWQSQNQDGSDYGVFARRFDAGGVAQSNEFQVNSFTSYQQAHVDVSSDDDGDFVVVWDSNNPTGYDVFARRFDSVGAALATEFRVNTATVSNQNAASVASGAGGDFIVAWNSFDQDGDSTGIFAQRFASNGTALAAEFQVNSRTESYQRTPRVAIDSDGDFVVVWFTEGPAGGSAAVVGRRFDSGGAAQASEFLVNAYTTGYHRFGDLTFDSGGGFVVVWHAGPARDGSQSGVFLRRFDPSAMAVGLDFQVNAYTTNNQYAAALAMADDGTFVVTWQSSGQDGSDYGVFARHFDDDGTALATEFQVNTHTTFYQRAAAVASQPGGRFVVAWNSYGQDGSSNSVFAQRLAAAPALDIDGNGTITALTDGLLVLRFLFGFTGTTLTGGGVGPNCTRCDAAAVVPYLTGLGLVLDGDDTGNLTPLADGLLVLRFLFGFSGPTLTTGAVGQGCMRCDSAAIVPYLQSLL